MTLLIARTNWVWRRVAKSSTRLFHFGRDSWHEGTMREIEAQWKGSRLKEALPTGDMSKKPYFVLSMFPYPSGRLHMGHVRVYAISDALAHFHRMQGRRIIHPMGWDAFGLPAENAAIERGVKPQDWTEQNIATMRDQFFKLGCAFDWDREVSTCDPAYYKWTQSFFVKMMERGLVYQKEAVVNWDPVDQTVLADEQVDDYGRSWRSGALVEKKPLRQWFIRTTSFAKELYEGLEDPSLENWRDVKLLQQNWIGECTGTRLDLEVEGLSDSFSKGFSVDAWIEFPEFIHGATFLALAAGHILDQPRLVEREFHCHSLKSPVKLLSVSVVNPFGGRRIPVLVLPARNSNFLPQDCSSVVATACVDQLAAQVAQELELLDHGHAVWNEQQQVVINSGEELNGKTRQEAKEEVLRMAKKRGIGGHLVSPRLKDWLISRQRYWGTPIPVVHCRSCGPVPVPEESLPVLLPQVPGLSSKGDSPLARQESWIKTKCPKCNGDARRETDTMDTFVDSAWYYLRYLDPKNDNEAVSAEAASALPVDVYIGGKEHATLHLYFARFFARFLHSMGISPVKEPFRCLMTQGMVKGKSYRLKGSGEYLHESDVDLSDVKHPVAMGSGQPVVTTWEKMSKSKLNGVDPEQLLDKYGCDTLKMMILSGVGPASHRNWSEESYPRIRNLQVRFLKLVSMAVTLEHEQLPPLPEDQLKEWREKLWDARNYYLKGVNHSYSFTRNLAVVLARIQSFLGELWNAPGQVKRDVAGYQRCLASAIIMMAPIAPHFSAELWRGLSSTKTRHCDEFLWEKSVFHQPWPQLDPTYNLKLLIRAEKNTVSELSISQWKFATLTQEEAFDLACHDPKVQSSILPYEFTHKFSIFPSFEAYLDFDVTMPEPTEDEERQIKEEKRLKKKRKAEKRERNLLAAKKAELKKQLLQEQNGEK